MPPLSRQKGPGMDEGMHLQQPLHFDNQQIAPVNHNPGHAQPWFHPFGHSADAWQLSFGGGAPVFDHMSDFSAASPPSLCSGNSDMGQSFMEGKIEPRSPSPPSPWTGNEPTYTISEGHHAFGQKLEVQGLGIDHSAGGSPGWHLQRQLQQPQFPTYYSGSMENHGLPHFHPAPFASSQVRQTPAAWTMPTNPLQFQPVQVSVYNSALPNHTHMQNSAPSSVGAPYSDVRAPLSASEQRRNDDRILLEGKRNGLTYKEIRNRMAAKVAESTLRGRYRSLTKARIDRVRKPVWTPQDETELLKEVAREELIRNQKVSKISWKRVGEYIKANGGTYHFGNSTCKKRYMELKQAGEV